MSGTSRYIIGEFVTAKAIHVLHLSECARRYGSEKKTKTLDGSVIGNINKPTATGRASWFVRVRFDLGGGKTKLHELSVRSVKIAVAPVIRQEEPEEPDIPDAVPIDGRLRVSAIAVPVGEDESEAPNNGGASSNAIVPNPVQPIHPPVPHNNQEVVEVQPALPEEDELVPVPQPIPIVPDRIAPLPAPPAPHPAPTDADPILSTNHEYNWYKYDNPDNLPLNGRLRAKRWGIRLPTGDRLDQSGDISKDKSPMDYFFFSFPTEQINLTIRLTNSRLHANGKKLLDKREFYKFLGIVILITRLEFTSRANLWSPISMNKYIPAVKLGKMTGMPRARFDEIWSEIRWSEQPDVRPPEMLHSEYRWLLVDDMVDIFNRHREDSFIPSEWLCVDESISRWYGLGGGWINIGLPMYIAIDRKPENGCEIQNSACSESGVMLRLLLVKGEEDSELHTQENSEGMQYGTAILKYLVLPWANSERGVCADSYFASVSSAEEMMRIGIRFIGVVNTATKKFPMAYLSSIELNQGRGQLVGVVLKSNGAPTMMAYVWMDRDRRYFISTASSLQDGKDYSRIRWRQPDLPEEDFGEVNNEEAERQELTVSQPKCSKIYYNTCAAIDQHNRHRQDTLKVERKMQTKSWDKRVTTSIFGMYCVDAWLMYRGCTTDTLHKEPDLNQQELYCVLTEELIDNNIRNRRRTRRSQNDSQNMRSASPENINLAPELRATKSKKKHKNGKMTKFCKQGRCRMCYKGRPTTICSACEDNDGFIYYFCDPRVGRNCFKMHVEQQHL